MLSSAAVEGSLIPTVAAATAGDVGYPLKEGEKLTMDVRLDESVQAPFEAGAVIGEALWKKDGEIVARVPLEAQSGAELDIREPLSFWQRLTGLLSGTA